MDTFVGNVLIQLISYELINGLLPLEKGSTIKEKPCRNKVGTKLDLLNWPARYVSDREKFSGIFFLLLS